MGDSRDGFTHKEEYPPYQILPSPLKAHTRSILDAWNMDSIALAIALDGKHIGEHMLVNSLTRTIEWTDDAGKVTMYKLSKVTENDVYYFKQEGEDMGSHYEAMHSRDRTTQVGGDHYSKRKIQPIDIIREYKMDFFEGNALKYLLRYKDKGGVQDLDKCKDYIDMVKDNTKDVK